MDMDIKCTMEGEVITEVPKKVLETGYEEGATRVERAVAFVDTWTVMEPDRGAILIIVCRFVKEWFYLIPSHNLNTIPCLR